MNTIVSKLYSSSLKIHRINTKLSNISYLQRTIVNKTMLKNLNQEYKQLYNQQRKMMNCHERMYKSYYKSYFQSDKDRALFWIYLLTQNKTFLNKTAQSWDNNLYSLYAKELLEVPIDNIYYDIDIPNTPTTYIH